MFKMNKKFTKPLNKDLRRNVYDYKIGLSKGKAKKNYKGYPVYSFNFTENGYVVRFIEKKKFAFKREVK